MAQQTINLSTANDNLGTPLRTGGDYINDMFAEIYAKLKVNATGFTETTGDCLTIDCDTNTTGGLLSLVSDSSSTATRTLAEIINENSAATGATCLTIRQDAAAPALDIRGGSAAVEGADLVTNGTFAADTDWTKGTGWTIAAGVATKAAGVAANLTQNLGEASGNMYRIRFDYTRTAGTLSVAIGGVTHATTFSSASGSGDIYILATGTGDLTFAAGDTFAGTVDNVVVNQIAAIPATTITRGAAGTIRQETRPVLYNHFYGAESGKFATTANFNTSFGQQTLEAITIGIGNNAIGYRALQLATTANYNNAFGHYALTAGATAQNNNAFGYQALYASTVGAYNNAFGYQALLANTSGLYNIAIGYKGLLVSTSGSYNTAIGRETLSGCTTGASNTAIGYYAGDNITSGSRNLVIGHNVDAQSATANDQLVIGNIIFGTTVDGTGTTASTGNIGICEPAPSGKLTINSDQERVALLIDAENATSIGVDVACDVLTSGKIARFATASATASGNLVEIINDHTSATAIPLYIRQDSVITPTVLVSTLAANTATRNVRIINTAAADVNTGGGIGFGVGGGVDKSAIFFKSGSLTNGRHDLMFCVDIVDDANAVAFTDAKLTISGSTGDITLADGVDLIVNATTGTKIGTAVTQKLGFWNATPVVQPVGVNQAALTNSTGGTYDGTLAAVTASGDDAVINNNFTDLHTLVNEIRTALVNTGLMKGAA